MIRILHGDCRAVLASLPDASVQCCVTSPPYWGLRDYGVDGQIGMEQSPDAYVAVMVAVFREVRRVLRDDGTVFLNLGDSYTGNPNSGGNNKNDGGPAVRVFGLSSKPGKPKDLLMIPARVALALQADGWWLRSDIIWHKPNPMPESVTDRPTSAHEHVFLLTKAERYFYDADAVKEPSISSDPRRPYTSEGAWQIDGRPVEQRHGGKPRTAGNKSHKYVAEYEASDSEEHRTKAGLLKVANLPWHFRNLRNVWTIATLPYSEAHFATFPPELAERCIKAGSKPGDTILDPFGGAGTTGLVADRLGRNAVLIELNATYADMARARIEKDAGMFAELSDA